MNEITAERKVTANAEAYAFAKEIEGSLIQNGTKNTLARVLDREAWFFSNRLFLPGTFPAKWLSIRNDLSKLSRWETDANIKNEEKIALEKKISNSIAEAIDEIYKDMDLKRIVINEAKTK